MIAKIIIRRRFKAGNAPQVIALLNDLRARAMQQPGYISGETLTKAGVSNFMVVIATWQSMEDWLAWRENPERGQFDAMLDIYQDGPTEYEELLLGTPLHSD